MASLYVETVDVAAALALVGGVAANVALVLVVASFVVFALSIGAGRALGAWGLHRNVKLTVHLLVLVGVVAVVVVSSAIYFGITLEWIFLGGAYLAGQALSFVFALAAEYNAGLELAAEAGDSNVVVPALDNKSGRVGQIGPFRSSLIADDGRTWYAPNSYFAVVGVADSFKSE